MLDHVIKCVIKFLSYIFIHSFLLISFSLFNVIHMRLLWYLIGIINILLILLNNPKASGFDYISNQISNFKSTRSTQQGLQLLIGINVILFFIFTILSVLFLYT